ncbi:MAG TPA: hypothetical protein VFU23_11525, partial [Gemmatimonadales bacterium]|nr:hypothetical protein [Gemmatimonadales bacterium]
EVDGDNTPFQNWVQQQTTRNASLFVSTSVQYQIANRLFGHIIQGGAEVPGGIFAINPTNLATDAALGVVGLPPLATLLAGSADRPIGLIPGGLGNSALPNTTVVLTREIIEQALAQRPVGATLVNGFPLALTKPGVMAIPFVDSNGGTLKDRPAIYLMILQVERLP